MFAGAARVSALPGSGRQEGGGRHGSGGYSSHEPHDAAERHPSQRAAGEPRGSPGATRAGWEMEGWGGGGGGGCWTFRDIATSAPVTSGHSHFGTSHLGT